MNYEESLAYIYSFADYEKTPVPHAAANYDLRRLVELMGYFDNPHLKTKSVHITGTKGKGSTAAMIAAVLTNAGYKTGLYTSPHLLTIRERIRIDDKYISESELVTIIEKLRGPVAEVNERATYGKLTTFEVLTAMAFIFFAANNVAIQVLEVGLGGTYDATNIIEDPLACVITSISIDHTEVLGNTLAAIAGEKCGIIKPGSIVVSSPQQDEAMRVIENRCSKLKARLIKIGSEIMWRNIDYDLYSQRILINGQLDTYSVTIPLLGDHQVINAATAVGTIELLTGRGYIIKKDNIIAGLANVNWPGRFQIVGSRPLIVLDGAHNADSAQKLGHAIVHYLGSRNVVFVIGMSSDKDLAGIAAGLLPVAGGIVATRSQNPRAMAPEHIAAEFEKMGITTEIASGVPAAVSRAVALAGPNGLVCVTGSLFVVAEALELAGSTGKR